MLSGRRAFAGDSPVETMSEILHYEPPSLSAHGVPVAVETLLRRCLRKHAGERFAAGGEVAAALRAVGRDLDATVSGTPSTMTSPASVETLAVLPFVNLGGDPEQDYFCAGMAAELIGALGRLPGLRVLARPQGVPGFLGATIWPPWAASWALPKCWRARCAGPRNGCGSRCS